MWSTWLFVFNVFLSSFYHNEPFPFEKKEIKLSGNCSDVVIAEWQDDNITDEKIKIIDSVCQNAFNNFKTFLKIKNISINKEIKLNVQISLLNVGDKPRQLNNIIRFYNQSEMFDENGKYITKYGRYYFKSRFIYTINEVIKNNKPYSFFQETLSHEIFHALIDQNDIRNKLPFPFYESDEKFAQEFAIFLNFGQ